MADLNGQWVPENEEEMDWLMAVNGITKSAYADGIEKEALVSGLMWLAGSIVMVDGEPPEEPVEEPDPPEKRDDCPECGADIESVRSFVGGEVLVSPCGCAVTVHQVPGWVDMPGDDDD